MSLKNILWPLAVGALIVAFFMTLNKAAAEIYPDNGHICGEQKEMIDLFKKAGHPSVITFKNTVQNAWYALTYNDAGEWQFFVPEAQGGFCTAPVKSGTNFQFNIIGESDEATSGDPLPTAR